MDIRYGEPKTVKTNSHHQERGRSEVMLYPGQKYTIWYHSKRQGEKGGLTEAEFLEATPEGRLTFKIQNGTLRYIMADKIITVQHHYVHKPGGARDAILQRHRQKMAGMTDEEIEARSEYTAKVRQEWSERLNGTDESVHTVGNDGGPDTLEE